tara:strand:+ start:21 stop:1079 length:1059 start_codon:yes stop_codon:yes gene_type:complete
MPGTFFSTKSRDLYYLSAVLQAQLADPRAYLCHPIVDKLWFTIPATANEVGRFTGLVKKKGYKTFCRLEMRSKKSRSNEPEIYTDCYHFVFENQSDHRIVVYCDTNSRGKRQNKMKIAFNPARFTLCEIRQFFGWLKLSNVFRNYHQTLFNSNVTRLDIAVDFFGIPTPMFLMNFSKSAKTNFYPVEDDDLCELVQTIVCGDPSRSHYDVYDRIVKFLQGRTLGLIGINAQGRPIPITRFERSYRPQQSNGNGLLLGKLLNAPDIWKSVKLFSPQLLSNIQDTNCLQSIARQGFAYWYSDRMKKGAPLPELVLKRHQLWANRAEFLKMQRKALDVIGMSILYPKKRRKRKFN